MNDLDTLLSIIENPTRRKILGALVREPHYPFQLSKALGISQQAVMKNLSVMEREGLVVSYREASSIGPTRIVYEPNAEFTLVMDMRSGMFRTRLILPNGEERPPADREEYGLEEARRMISGIDAELGDLERRRLELVRERESIMQSALSKAEDGDRSMLYEMLDSPDASPAEISARMKKGADRTEDTIIPRERKMRIKEVV
ncbi:MAG: helix-turn-helix domain-containing protein [Candidatus Methanomethylophilaceae archaeon]